MADIETSNVTATGNWDFTGGDIEVPAPAIDDNAATKKYVDDEVSGSAHTPEGTAVLSTGEAGATKFLREDGDGTCSWQSAAGGGIKLNEVNNPDVNKTFSMNGYQVKFNFTNPTTGDGAFEIDGTGAWDGDLFHVHQSAGNPASGDVAHFEATDNDIFALRVHHAGTGIAFAVGDHAAEVFEIDESGNVVTVGTVDGIDIATDVAANTSKNTNVTTNLSLGVGNATTEIIVSSDGTDVTLIEADTDNAGLLGADKWDEIVAATTHVADNTQAHSDYLKNDAVDVGVGLTMTGDNASVDTAYVPMVLYNTDDTPPAANTVPIGTLYVQYTA